MEHGNSEKLIALIESREARVAVIGLGYVGLPLALNLAGKGFATTGFDIDEAKVESLNAGRSYISHIPADRIAGLMGKSFRHATGDFSEIKDIDVVIICVPTPLGDNREPDLGYIISTADGIAPHIRAGQLIILESTT